MNRPNPVRVRTRLSSQVVDDEGDQVKERVPGGAAATARGRDARDQDPVLVEIADLVGRQPADVRGDADGRSVEPYVNGLAAAGVQNIGSHVASGVGELLPLETPQAFVALVRDYGRSIASIPVDI